MRLEEVPTPVPGAGEVLVKILSCGICATDFKAITGCRRNVAFPLIVGHEPAGIIAAIGANVRHFKVGDEVICQPSGYCGVCDNCRMGNTLFFDSRIPHVPEAPETEAIVSLVHYYLRENIFGD